MNNIKELTYIFNIISTLIQTKQIKSKINISIEDCKKIYKSFPGRMYKDENGDKCSHLNWFNYVVYNSVDRLETIDNSIIYSLEKLKEYNG